MNEVLKNIKPILFASSVLALLCAMVSIGMAQTPSGTVITNQAHGSFRFKTGTRDTISSNAARTIVSTGASPLLVLEKSVDRAFVAPGTNLTFTLKVSNRGTAAATSIVIIDSLPANSSFVSASDGGAMQG